MKPAKIRFKGFEWEHNPETVEVVEEDNIIEHKLSRGNSYTTKNSSKCRRIFGKGMLTGYDCLDQFNKLLMLQNSSESGILTISGIKPFYAYFKKLKLLCEPSDNMVSYGFEFIEDSDRNYTVKEKMYHTVENSETLWDIAFNYQKDIGYLVSLNPEIKRLDELEDGTKVRIC